MRGRHSNQENFGSEIVVRDNNLPQVVEDPHLSGAYLHNLVRHLTSSGVKDSMNRKEHLGSSRVFDRPHESFTNHQTLEEYQRAQPPQPSQPKKQARRRILTTRPYQEDLIDMAVARREVVTALRLHRASMTQNSDSLPQPPHQTHSESSLQATLQPQPKLKSLLREYSEKRDSNTTLNLSNNPDTLSYQYFSHQPPQTSHTWPICTSALPPIPENFNLLLPNQTLGLNLNLQDFDDLDTTLFQNNCIPARCYLSESPSTSISPPLSVAREETLYVGLSEAPLVANPDVKEDLGLHHAVDDEEMDEIRSVGEQHQIEWDDTMNMVTSAWWFNFLNSIENDTNSSGMEFPPWLDTNDNCFQQSDEHYSSDYSQDPTLPQMDIGEMEAMDGDWLN